GLPGGPGRRGRRGGRRPPRRDGPAHPGARCGCLRGGGCRPHRRRRAARADGRGGTPFRAGRALPRPCRGHHRRRPFRHRSAALKRHVLIAVTHLLGAGHLTRMAALARGLARAGHRVTLASGGMPAPLVWLDGVELLQLPPLRSNGVDFRTLLDAEGKEASPALLQERADLLARAVREGRPDAVITELFPFGRRMLAAEFITLIQAARALKPAPILL